MTNWEYLEALANDAPHELQAWFNAEHEAPKYSEATTKTEGDSREKLEADIYQSADKVQIETRGEYYIDTRMIIGWLDRQAAITEREVRDEREYGEPWWKYCETCETIAALTAELDSARRDRETYRELLGKAIDFAYAITLLVDEGAA